MNIIEAAKLMKQGRDVRLPYWGENEHIYYYSQIIRDERAEEYELSLSDLLNENWEEYKEGCKYNKTYTFEKALKAFKNGKSIKRSLWKTLDIKKEMNKNLYSEYSIIFTIDDFEANDWIILENKEE